MDRREFVTAVGIGSLAGVTGCIGNVVGTGMKEAEDPFQGVETSQSGSTETVQGDAVLPQGTYATREYNRDSTTQFSIDYETESGNVIDVITLRREEFENYSNGDNTVFLKEVSQMDAPSGNLSGTLNAGDYVIVFDNTTWGEGVPEGEETVSFSITVG